MLFQSATAVALLASFVAAQTQTNTTVNIGAISINTRSSYCQAQINSCGYLCSGRVVPGQNRCDETNLSYQCNCASNNSAPALALYENTIPYFLCQETFKDCNLANVGNKAGQDACALDEAANCGTLKPEEFTSPANPTTTTSSAGQSATSAAGGAASSAASGAGNAPSTTSSLAGAMPTMAATFGSGVVAAGVAAAFGLLL